MQLYMACLREHAGTSTPCRILVRDYLDCRMTKYVSFSPLFSLLLIKIYFTGCLLKRFDGERRLEKPWASKSRQTARSSYGECRQVILTIDLRNAKRQEFINPLPSYASDGYLSRWSRWENPVGEDRTTTHVRVRYCAETARNEHDM